MKKVPMGFIYVLKHPETDEIFYVGATTKSLMDRLRVHYQHIKEAKEGRRKPTKKMKYLIALGDKKCKIELIDFVIDGDIHELEKQYIKFYREQNINLTNMTDGGQGSFTSKYYSEKEKKIYGRKISEALKGKPKPKGFAENLSKKRKGTNNPASKPIKNGGILMFSKTGELKKHFIYGFEVDKYFNNKNAYGNIYRFVGNKTNFPYGYKFIWYKDYEK